jgi:hypothetical protein
MALIAFDLDNTLGYFSHVGVWADFFSIETLENQFNLSLNPKFKLTPALRKLLKTTEKLYIKKILENEEIVKSILRPNLDAMILPLIQSKKAGNIKAICIYSNSWNTFTPILGKALIEALYNCENLFDCVVDASHPIRAADWLNNTQGNQIKTFNVLKLIFRKLCKVKGPIKESDVLFVDERSEKHEISSSESNGLTYLKPTEYLPRLSMPLLKKVFNIGIEVLEETGLFKSSEYLESDIFHCIKFGPWGADNKYIPIQNIYDLIQISEESLRGSALVGHEFADDSGEITACLEEFLRN